MNIIITHNINKYLFINKIINLSILLFFLLYNFIILKHGNDTIIKKYLFLLISYNVYMYNDIKSNYFWHIGKVMENNKCSQFWWITSRYHNVQNVSQFYIANTYQDVQNVNQAHTIMLIIFFISFHNVGNIHIYQLFYVALMFIIIMF